MSNKTTIISQDDIMVVSRRLLHVGVEVIYITTYDGLRFQISPLKLCIMINREQGYDIDETHRISYLGLVYVYDEIYR